MNQLIKIHEIEGEPVLKDEQVWCGTISTDCVRTVCGHALDADKEVEYTEKFVSRGGITCIMCIDYIKQHKAYLL